MILMWVLLAVVALLLGFAAGVFWVYWLASKAHFGPWR